MPVNFGQVGSVLGQIDPLGTPCGCLKGPRVGQYALLLCIIHVRRVSGPFGPFQSIIGSPCNFGQIASVFRSNRHFWDPLWVPKRTQGGPICLSIMYYTCETCFTAIWTLPEHHRDRMLISASFWSNGPFWDPCGYLKGPSVSILNDSK